MEDKFLENLGLFALCKRYVFLADLYVDDVYIDAVYEPWFIQPLLA
jgi:hypothetical protein